MTFVVELAIVLIVTLVVGFLFAFLLRRTGPWPRLIWFFILLFLGTWAVGVWARPFGPAIWGVDWVPFVVGAMVIAMFLAAVSPVPVVNAGERVEAILTGITVFFWFLLMFAAAAIALHYWLPEAAL